MPLLVTVPFIKQSLNVLYRSAAEEFAARVRSGLGDQVDSIVLYGSAARGEAKRYSDVDMLIISPVPKNIREKISTIRSDFAYESNYAFFISLAHLGRDEIEGLIRLGSPFIQDVVVEGVVLYDNGVFSRLRERAVSAGR